MNLLKHKYSIHSEVLLRDNILTNDCLQQMYAIKGVFYTN